VPNHHDLQFKRILNSLEHDPQTEDD